MKSTILLIILHHFYSVVPVIVKQPGIVTYPMGTNVTLTCVTEAGNELIWTSSGGDILFSNEVKFSNLAEKYDNFKVEVTEMQSSMIITDARTEDEGEYFCSDTSGKEKLQLKIEVSPKLTISYRGFNETGPTKTWNISVICLAKGARPAVSLRFNIGKSGWLMPTTNETTPRGLLFDTNAKLNFQLPDDPNGIVVTCQSFGQISIPEKNQTETLLTPICIITKNSIEASCRCTAIPRVHKYTFSIDGKQNIVGKNLTLGDFEGSEISCSGENYIGVGISNVTSIDPPDGTPFPVYYLIIIVTLVIGIPVVVIVIVAVCLFRLRNKGKSNKPDVPPTSPEMEPLNETSIEEKGNNSSKNITDTHAEHDVPPTSPEKEPLIETSIEEQGNISSKNITNTHAEHRVASASGERELPNETSREEKGNISSKNITNTHADSRHQESIQDTTNDVTDHNNLAEEYAGNTIEKRKRFENPHIDSGKPHQPQSPAIE